MARLRRPIGGVLADRHGVRERLGCGAAGEADGIAKSLNIGNPADGAYALDAVRSTGGAMAQVTDDEIRAGILLLARTTGVFAETAGGVTIAVLRKLSESGALDTGQETVVYNTGDGLKTLDAVSDRAQLTAVLPPTVNAIRTAGLLRSAARSPCAAPR